MRLAELQHAVQACVLHGDTAAQSFVRGSEGSDVHARLQIYRHAFLERLVDALAVTYPASCAASGEDEFRELTRAFVARHPPHHFSIRYFGRELDAFIAQQMPGVRGKVLAELARWEWTLATVFDAADAEPLTAAAFAHIEPVQWGELRFELAPYVLRLSLTTNAVQWWRAMTQSAPRPSRWRTAKRIEWVLWRSELKTYFRSSSADEAAALDAAAEGQTFGAICERVADANTRMDPAVRAAMLLQSWIRDGWVARVIRES